jgi:hypothetical protein
MDCYPLSEEFQAALDELRRLIDEARAVEKYWWCSRFTVTLI